MGLTSADPAALRRGLEGLLERAGLRLLVEQGGPSYDGSGVLRLPLYLLAAHELGHWAVASDEERLRPDWGLGDDPIYGGLGHGDLARTEEVEGAVEDLELRLLLHLDPSGRAAWLAAAEDPRPKVVGALPLLERGLAELRRIGALPPS